jgi:hypothetical protein
MVLSVCETFVLLSVVTTYGSSKPNRPAEGGVGTLGGGQLLDRGESPLGIANFEAIFGFGRFFRTTGSSLPAQRRPGQRHVGEGLQVELAQPRIATLSVGINRKWLRV